MRLITWNQLCILPEHMHSKSVWQPKAKRHGHMPHLPVCKLPDANQTSEIT